MQRSLQSAGVRAGSAAVNMQYHIVRSLAISLAIVLVITRSQAGGFAIRRADNWDSTTDLDTGESSLLEVKYDLKNTTDFKQPDSSQTIRETETVISISDFNKINNVTTAISVEHKETTPQEINEFSKNGVNMTVSTAIISSTDLTTSTIEPNKELNVSSSSVSNNIDDISTSSTPSTILEHVKEQGLLNATQNYENDTMATDISTSFASALRSDTTISQGHSNDIISTENMDVSKVTQSVENNVKQTLENNATQSLENNARQSLEYNVTQSLEYNVTQSLEYNVTKSLENNVTKSVENNVMQSLEQIVTESMENIVTQINTETYQTSTETIKHFTAEIDSLSASNENDVASTKTETNNENTTETSTDAITFTSTNKADLDASTEQSTSTDVPINSDQTISNINVDAISDTTTDIREITTLNIATDTTEIYLENSTSATTNFPNEETFNTETIQDEITTTELPHWKVYKTIQRKRPTTTSTEETTLPDLEMTKSESARISLERLLNNTPIPSLVELKNDLLNAQEYSAILFDRVNISTQKLEVETQTPKLEIVSSKRAGYLDNKEATTLEPPQLATAVMYEDKDVSNDTETFGTMYESDAEVGYLPDIRNVTGAESQSQLVEDAMKEELLMEKTLSENILLKEEARQRDSRPTTKEVRPGLDELSTPEIITEDLLSVKPISSDKRKSNSIYVTNSVTYKPLKKLDVQHPKQFVRDPDDNSWRNESISSLGIVFKPKNASKSFTEVLKNKTTELSNMVEKVDKSNVPDLRVRLEKIAEVRKSKKKRINKFGDTVYSDYEENSGENANISKEDITSPIVPSKTDDFAATTPLTPSKTEADLTVNAIWKGKTNIFGDDGSTTEKFKKIYNLADYYDVTDDYDADYVTLSKIDLKRFTVPFKSGKDTYSATRPPETTFTTRPAELTTKPMIITYMPDRQPTIQYFPPTKKATTPASQKVNVNDYDDRFNKKLSMFAYKDTPKMGYDVTFATASPLRTKKVEQPTILTPKPVYTPLYLGGKVDKNMYLTTPPHMTEPDPQGGFVPNDGTFNRASYVIKHYKDFINDAAKADDDKVSDYLPFTESPLRGVTMSQIPNLSVQKETKPEDYDYDTHFRKDIVNRFVDNFNQNSERFKVDFPILYNNSVVHRKGDPNGKVLASSSAFMKRLYETPNPRSQFLLNVKPCNANCESMTVDLSPAYELHYYVPDQEEKEEIETRPNTLPYRNYRL